MLVRTTLLWMAFAICLFAAPPGRAADGAAFLVGFDDVPAMPGLETAGDDGALVFANPAGRIAESVYQGAVSRRAVEAFYAGTLPQLGWTAAGPGRYHREGEELRLEFLPAGKTAGKMTTVRFVLLPR